MIVCLQTPITVYNYSAKYPVMFPYWCFCSMDFRYGAVYPPVSSDFRTEVGLQLQFWDYDEKLCDFFS